MKSNEPKKSIPNKMERDNLTVFLLPKEKNRAKADLLVRVYRNHLVIDNGKSVICIDTNLPSTQRILQSIRENRLTQELTELLKDRDMLPMRNWINVKIVEIEDEKKSIRPQYVETVPLERRNGDLTMYIKKWIDQNFPFSTKDEKLKVESDILNGVHSPENLYLYPSPTHFYKANVVQYHQQKDRFRRRKKIEIPLKQFPFVGRPFRGIYPSNQIHFVYPHLLYKYIIKNRIHEKPLPKPPSVLPSLPSSVSPSTAPRVTTRPTGRESSNLSVGGGFPNPPTPSSVLSHHFHGSRMDTPTNLASPRAGGFGTATPYSNYVTAPGASEAKKGGGGGDPHINTGLFLKKWMERYSKVKIATRHLLKPNEEVRLLCFRDIKGRVWTFELRSFLRAKPYFQHRHLPGGHRIVYEARMRRSDEKTRPSLRMVIGKGHESYEEYIRRLKDLFSGRASIVYDQVLDYRTYLKSLAKGRSQRQQQQKKKHKQQLQQQKSGNSTNQPSNNNNNKLSAKRPSILLLNNNNQQGNLQPGLYVPPSPLRTPSTNLTGGNEITTFPFGGGHYLPNNNNNNNNNNGLGTPIMQPPPPPPPPPAVVHAVEMLLRSPLKSGNNNNNNNNNSKEIMMMMMNVPQQQQSNNTKKKKVVPIGKRPANLMKKKPIQKKKAPMKRKKKNVRGGMVKNNLPSSSKSVHNSIQQQQQRAMRPQHATQYPSFHHQNMNPLQQQHHYHNLRSHMPSQQSNGNNTTSQQLHHKYSPIMGLVPRLPPQQQQQQPQYLRMPRHPMTSSKTPSDMSSTVVQNSNQIRKVKKEYMPISDSFRFDGNL